MGETPSRQIETKRQVELLLKIVDETTGEPFSDLFEDGFLIADAEGVITHANHTAESMLRRLSGLDEVVGTEIRKACPDPEIERAILVDKTGVSREVRLRDHVLLVRAIPLFKSSGISGYAMVMRDITQIREKDKQIAVKSAIIQEIHHRMKNDLQTIAGLLRLQQLRLESPAAKDAFSDSINRILAVATVHEVLCRGGPDLIDVIEVAEKIVKMHLGAVRGTEGRITASVTGDRILLSGRQAMSIGLIINELTQNAIKHAFRGRADGEILVTLENRDQSVLVRVSDNGNGFPDNFATTNPPTLGLSIVRTLAVDDLGGVIGISNRNGACVEVVFPRETTKHAETAEMTGKSR